MSAGTGQRGSNRAKIAAGFRRGATEDGRARSRRATHGLRSRRYARVGTGPGASLSSLRASASRNARHGGDHVAFVLAFPVPAPAVCRARSRGAPVARAEITPEAAKVVARFVEATGGADAVHAVKSMHVKAHDPGVRAHGHDRSVDAAPDRRATSTEIGPFKMQERLRRHDRLAHRSHGQARRSLDGKDLEDAQRRAPTSRTIAGSRPIRAAARSRSWSSSRRARTTRCSRSRRRPAARAASGSTVKTGLIDRATSQRDQLQHREHVLGLPATPAAAGVSRVSAHPAHADRGHARERPARHGSTLIAVNATIADALFASRRRETDDRDAI